MYKICPEFFLPKVTEVDTFFTQVEVLIHCTY